MYLKQSSLKLLILKTCNLLALRDIQSKQFEAVAGACEHLKINVLKTNKRNSVKFNGKVSSGTCSINEFLTTAFLIFTPDLENRITGITYY